ncbi:nuclear pore-associated protein 1-like [Dasypus novemcinctus]|uniref:nuclear pore-associated protein 1-like n=1 Tax=Dasypus novemcinctus TaxID=9361 RepID=UPI00265F1E42|nr:nuclear pore-associated protein 1-like [Dasypus novemcinctus]
MGNFLSRLQSQPCSCCSGPSSHPPVYPLHSSPGARPDGPAAPAPLPGPAHRLSGPDAMKLLRSGIYIAPKRRYPIWNPHCSSLGVLPSAFGRESLKPVLSSWNSKMFGYSSGVVRIPRTGRKLSLLDLAPEQVIPRRLEPSRHLPPLHLKESGPRAPGEGREERAEEKEEEDCRDTRGQDGQRRDLHSRGSVRAPSRPLEPEEVVTSFQGGPGPLNKHLHCRDRQGERRCQEAQVSVSSSVSGWAILGLDRPAGSILPPGRGGPGAAGLPGASSSCSLPSERPPQAVLEGSHGRSSPGSQPGEETQEEHRPAEPSRSAPLLTPASVRPRKWKRPRPLPLPLLLPLSWGGGERPPALKFPRRAAAGDPCWEEKAEQKQGHGIMEEGGREASAESSVPEPASSPSLPLGETTDALHQAPVTGPIPATTATAATALADLPARPPILSAPVPSASRPPTAATAPHPLEAATPSHSLRAATSISDLPTPANAIALSFQHTTPAKPSPTPMCIDPPPLFSPTPPTFPSTRIPVLTSQPLAAPLLTPTIPASTSAHGTSQPASVPSESDMDTTPPSHAVIFLHPPSPVVPSLHFQRAHCYMKQTPLANAPDSTNLPVPVDTTPTPVFILPLGPAATPQPTFGGPGGQQPGATFPTVPVSAGLPISPVATDTPAGSPSACSAARLTSDPEDMDTTPPPQAAGSLQAAPVSAGLPISPVAADTPAGSPSACSATRLTSDPEDMDTMPPPQAAGSLQAAPVSAGLPIFPVTTDTPAASPSARSATRLTSDPEDMDTTPPSQAVGSLQAAPVSTGLPISPVATDTPAGSPSACSATRLTSDPEDMDTTPPPQAAGSLQAAPVSAGLPISPVATETPAGSPSACSAARLTSDPEDMDTTPPPQAVGSLQAAPVSRKNVFPFYAACPGTDNTPCNGSIASNQVSTGLPAPLVHGPPPTHNLPFYPGTMPQPTFGVPNGQQPGANSFNPSFRLGKSPSPAQAAGFSSPTAQPPSGGVPPPAFVGLTSPGSRFGIPVSTLKGSSRCAVSASAPGPSCSSGALTFGAGPSGRSSTTSAPQGPTGQSILLAGGTSVMPVVQDTSASTSMQGTRSPPDKKTGGTTGGDNTIQSWGAF